MSHQASSSKALAQTPETQYSIAGLRKNSYHYTNYWKPRTSTQSCPSDGQLAGRAREATVKSPLAPRRGGRILERLAGRSCGCIAMRSHNGEGEQVSRRIRRRTSDQHHHGQAWSWRSGALAGQWHTWSTGACAGESGSCSAGGSGGASRWRRREPRIVSTVGAAARAATRRESAKAALRSQFPGTQGSSPRQGELSVAPLGPAEFGTILAMLANAPGGATLEPELLSGVMRTIIS